MKSQFIITCLGQRQATLLLCQFPWIQKLAMPNNTTKLQKEKRNNSKLIKYLNSYISNFLSQCALWSENRQKTRLQFLLQVIFMNTSNWNQAKPIFSDSFLSFQGQRLIPLKRGHSGDRNLDKVTFQ